MTEERKTNTSPWRYVKGELAKRLSKLLTQFNVYTDTRLTQAPKERAKCVGRLRDALLGLSQMGRSSHNIDEDVAEDAFELWKDFNRNTRDENIERLNDLVPRLTESMGEQGFLDTRVQSKDKGSTLGRPNNG